MFGTQCELEVIGLGTQALAQHYVDGPGNGPCPGFGGGGAQNFNALDRPGCQVFNREDRGHALSAVDSRRSCTSVLRSDLTSTAPSSGSAETTGGTEAGGAVCAHATDPMLTHAPSPTRCRVCHQ